MIPSESTITQASPLPKAVLRSLVELRTLLERLTPDQYAASGGTIFANSSIGAHVRHTLDHARALVDGWCSGTVDYDHRARGTSIETEISCACVELTRLVDSYEELSTIDLDAQINVQVLPSRGGPSVRVASTLARELAFVLSHTIHHAATIRSMTQSLGLHVSDSFGYAPSTLAHFDRCAGAPCAQ